MSEYPNDNAQLDALAQLPRIDWGFPLLCVDVETTGFEDHAAITEIAVIILDRHLEVVDSQHIRVEVPCAPCGAPWVRRADVDPWVRAYTAWGRAGSDGAWRDLGAVSLAEALSLLGRAIEAAQLVGRPVGVRLSEPQRLGILGHHYSFDVETISRWWSMVEYREVCPAARRWLLDDGWSRYSLDTRHLCATRYAQGRLQSRSLAVLAKHLGIDHRPHDALSDAEATAAAARILLSGRA